MSLAVINLYVHRSAGLAATAPSQPGRDVCHDRLIISPTLPEAPGSPPKQDTLINRNRHAHAVETEQASTATPKQGAVHQCMQSPLKRVG